MIFCVLLLRISSSSESDTAIRCDQSMSPPYTTASSSDSSTQSSAARAPAAFRNPPEVFLKETPISAPVTPACASSRCSFAQISDENTKPSALSVSAREGTLTCVRLPPSLSSDGISSNGMLRSETKYLTPFFMNESLITVFSMFLPSSL